MTATLLDGKAIASQIQAELTHEVAAFVDRKKIKPCLAAVLVGADPGSQVYVRSKSRGCEKSTDSYKPYMPNICNLIRRAKFSITLRGRNERARSEA